MLDDGIYGLTSCTRKNASKPIEELKIEYILIDGIEEAFFHSYHNRSSPDVAQIQGLPSNPHVIEWQRTAYVRFYGLTCDYSQGTCLTLKPSIGQ